MSSFTAELDYLLKEKHLIASSQFLFSQFLSPSKSILKITSYCSVHFSSELYHLQITSKFKFTQFTQLTYPTGLKGSSKLFKDQSHRVSISAAQSHIVPKSRNWDHDVNAKSHVCTNRQKTFMLHLHLVHNTCINSSRITALNLETRICLIVFTFCLHRGKLENFIYTTLKLNSPLGFHLSHFEPAGAYILRYLTYLSA